METGTITDHTLSKYNFTLNICSPKVVLSGTYNGHRVRNASGLYSGVQAYMYIGGTNSSGNKYFIFPNAEPGNKWVLEPRDAWCVNIGNITIPNTSVGKFYIKY